jgi:hypothetical protein
MRCTALKGFGAEIMLCDMVEQLAVELMERTGESIAQPHGAPDDRVEDRLHVGLRPTDDTQDLSRRRLLLQRLGDLGVGLRQRFVLLL